MNTLTFPFTRVLRHRSARLALFGWCAIALVMAFLARGRGDGSTHVLLGGYSRFALPLLCFAVVSAVSGRRLFVSAIEPLTLLGASRVRASAFTHLGTMMCTAFYAAILGVLVVLVSHGSSDPPLGHDLFVTCWVSALGAAAYASFFFAGSTLFGNFGRTLFLILDFILGAGDTTSALLVPRGHIRSLLGGSDVLTLSQHGSIGALFAITTFFFLFTLLRARR